ncbi:plexin-A3-like, partial [Amphiura filiformis]|uniref:plexin-A3-like n=1 Tax=Amphiura filiformis TaxID=82378 RepID=UPI003B214C7B
MDIVQKISILFLSLICLSITGRGLASRGDLSAYRVAQFLNEDGNSKFDKFVINANTGDIYIGATNRIYHVKSNFALKEFVQTNGQCGDRCINHNKILLISYESQKLIVCGSEIEGRCQMRSLQDISVSLENGNTVVPSKMLSTEAIIARGPTGGNMLYIGATYDPTRYGIGKVTPIARRTIWAYGDALLASDAEIFFTSSVATNPKPFMINYMDSYDWKGYTHFVTIQQTDYNPLPYLADSNYVSKVSRVCQASKNFDAFTEVVLECQGQSGGAYNLVQSVRVGKPGLLLAESMNVTENEDILYGVFARSVKKDGYEPSNSTSICIYKMADIDAAFAEAVYGCLRNGSEYELEYVKNSHCPRFPSITPEISAGMECDAFCFSFAKAKKSVVAQAAFEHTQASMSSINVKTELNHTIAYIGTSHGDLLKIQVDNKTNGRLYETLHLKSPVLRELHFDEETEHVFVSTEREFQKLKTSNCSFFHTSEECIGVNGAEDGDPHCGWCTEQTRCTRYHECTSSGG